MLKVHLTEGKARQVEVWKGMTSAYEVFYALRRNSDVLISDNFRSILSRLPVSERQTSETALVDHFLFRRVGGTESYSQGIARPGHGERLTLDLAAGVANRIQFDRVSDVSVTESAAYHVERIDEALARVLEPIRDQDRVANFFSGGVDSTLIQSYLGGAVPPVDLVTQSPAFDQEADYASRAAALLGLEAVRIPVREADFMDQLEEAVDAIGMAPHFLQIVLLGSAFKSDFRKFIMGERADALFGMTGRVARIAAYFAFPLGVLFLKAVTAPIPASARVRWHLLAATAAKLSRAPEDPFGFGCQSTVWTEFGLMDRIFDPALVRERLKRRREYLIERVDLSARRGRYKRHLECAQWLEYLCEDTVMLFRHFANAYGKSVFVPFITGAVVATALEVPADHRYIKGMRNKYLLKDLLQKRVPKYPVDQRKGFTDLPFSRYYKEGPLSRVWERYEVPDFIEPGLAREVVQAGNWMTWNAICYAVLKKRVLDTSDLAPVPGSWLLEWELN